jgi:hypothetical protein
VIQFCDGSYLEDQDQWWLSGVYRDVSLQYKPAARLADYRLRTHLGSGEPRLQPSTGHWLAAEAQLEVCEPSFGGNINASAERLRQKLNQLNCLHHYGLEVLNINPVPPPAGVRVSAPPPHGRRGSSPRPTRGMTHSEKPRTFVCKFIGVFVSG